MKKLILASAVMFAMTACETSTSANGGSGKGVNGYSCKVTRTDNTVTLYETYALGTYQQTQTVYQDQYGFDYSVWITDIYSNDPAEAAEECADERDEARNWKDGSYQVECTSNSVHVRQRDDSGRENMDGTVVEFQAMCDEGYRRAQNGTLYEDDDEDWD